MCDVALELRLLFGAVKLVPSSSTDNAPGVPRGPLGLLSLNLVSPRSQAIIWRGGANVGTPSTSVGGC